MADVDVELPDLPAAVAVNDSDLLHVRQGTEDKKSTVLILQDNLDLKYLRQDDNLASIDDVSTARANLDVQSTSEAGDTFLEEDNNLSDLTNTSVARSNLGLGSMAVLDKGTGVDDFRNNSEQDDRYCLESNNLSDVASASTSFNNIKQPATTTSTGVVEAATTAEAQAGTANKFPDSAKVKDILGGYGYTDQIVSAPSGNFTGGSLKVARVGDIVTITGNLQNATPFSLPSSDVGFIPTWARPVSQSQVTNVYYTDSTAIYEVRVLDTGQLRGAYRGWDGSGTNTTTTREFTISYTI